MVSLPNGYTVVIGGWPDKKQLLRVTGMRSVWMTGSVTDGGHWQPWPSLNHPRATHSCIVTKYKVIRTQKGYCLQICKYQGTSQEIDFNEDAMGVHFCTKDPKNNNRPAAGKKRGVACFSTQSMEERRRRGCLLTPLTKLHLPVHTFQPR